MFESLAIDVKFALRRLHRRRTYTALTVLTLALGVAGTAAVYGIARRLLFDPLPVRAEQEVVSFWFDGAWSQQKFLAVRPVMERLCVPPWATVVELATVSTGIP